MDINYRNMTSVTIEEEILKRKLQGWTFETGSDCMALKRTSNALEVKVSVHSVRNCKDGFIEQICPLAEFFIILKSKQILARTHAWCTLKHIAMNVDLLSDKDFQEWELLVGALNQFDLNI